MTLCVRYGFIHLPAGFNGEGHSAKRAVLVDELKKVALSIFLPERSTVRLLTVKAPHVNPWQSRIEKRLNHAVGIRISV
jgi:hypothetical protein